MARTETLEGFIAGAGPCFYRRNSPETALFRGSCLDLLPRARERSVDMIFADPPYNLSNGGFSVHAGRRVSVDKGRWDRSRGLDADFDFHLKWIAACRRVLKDDGTIWISGTYHSIFQCGFALQKERFHVLNDISWYKPNASPNLSCRMFAASHESLIWARKSKDAKHYFDYGAMKDGDWPDDAIKKPGRQMRSVWSISSPPKSEKVHGKHPAQKPLALLSRIVLASTKANAVILDPFAGSSTTGIAAYMHGRRFVGMETEEKFLNLSKRRFGDLAGAA